MWANAKTPITNKSSRDGFTIVELLIVIVVIGILATITIVAYNGIQDRARNTTRVAAARHALGLIQTYATLNQTYPTLTDSSADGTFAACIGNDWPYLQTQRVCWNVFTDGGAPGVSTFIQNNSVNSALASIGSLPNYPKVPIWQGVYQSRPVNLYGLAIVYRPTTANTLFPLGHSLIYILKGDPATVDCGVSGANKSEVVPGVTRCLIPLPDNL
jgi:prepilin-type N-terminal cleavage/methylation domain-containing protein